MKLKTFFILNFLSFGIISNAQKDFRQGYVILNSGDTLKGEIDCRGDNLMGSVCSFRPGHKNPVTMYNPGDILSYRVDATRYFASKSIKTNNGNTMVFLEFLVKGKINIYYYRNEVAYRYFIEKDSVGLTELPYEKSIKYNEQGEYEYVSREHIGILNYYLKDAPGIQTQIQNIHKPDHQNLIRLMKLYYKTVCKDVKCIEYEKYSPAIRIALEPTFAFVRYREASLTVSEFGGHAYFWLPRTSEKLYFKTGFIVQPVSYMNEKFVFYRIPLQFQYLYPSKIFIPKISYGLNIILSDYDRETGSLYINHTLSINPGFMYKLRNSIYASFNLNTDFTPLTDLFKYKSLKFNLISYSVEVGIYFKI